MANEFKVKKGLIVTGADGGTVVDVQGSQGQLFSVTDDLSGSIFAVSDISGVPILDVNSSGLSTFDGDVNLPDNNKLLLGTGNDLEIYHTGSNSFIQDVGTGMLAIDTNGTDVRITKTDSEFMAKFVTDAEVQLYYNGSKKFETQNGGAKVTGSLSTTATGGGTGILMHTNSGISINSNLMQFWTGQSSGYKFYSNSTGDETNELLHLDASGNATFAGNVDAIGNVEARGYLQAFSTIYMRGTTRILNKNASGWLNFLARDTSGSQTVMNISNVGTLNTSGNATFAGDVTSPTFLGDLNGTINTATTGTTQTAGDNSTKIATTAYADAAAAAVPIGNYLPLSAGSGSPLTGTLYGTSTNFSGNGSYVGSMNLGTEASTAEAYLTIGQGRTDSGFSYIDLVGDITYPDYGLRIIRGNTGANAGAGIYHRGTGNLEIQATDSASMLLRTNNTTALTLTNTQNAIFTGNVGIGETSPNAKLEVDVTGNNTVLKLTRDTGTNGVFDIDFEGANTNFNSLYSYTFQTGGVERMRITSTGNVGIGTSTPNAKLDIQGTQGQLFSVTDDLSGDIFSVADISGVPIMNVNSDGTSYFDGNVGIGTESPGAKLEIKDGNLWLNGATSNYNPEIFFIDDAGPTEIAGAKIRYENNNGNLYFDHKWDTATSGFFFRNRVDGTALNTMSLVNGKVGIGTTSPNYKLTSYSTTSEGNGTDEFPIVAGKANAIGNFTGIGLAGYIAANGAVKAGIALERVGSYGTGKLHFLNNDTLNNLDATLSDSKMTILRNGNVGIGTTSPSAGLSVNKYGSKFTSDAQYIQPSGSIIAGFAAAQNTDNWIGIHGNYGDSTGSANLLLQANFRDIGSQAGHYIGSKSSGLGSANLVFGQLTTNTDINTAPILTERMRITSGGNVGIGTTSPDANLEIGESANIPPKLRLTLNDSGSSIGNGQEYGAIQWKGNDGQGDGVRADIRVFGEGSSGETYMTFATMPAGTSASTNAQERMRITSGGNVGIGTNDPGANLHIREGASNSYASLRLQGSNRGGVIEMYNGASLPVSSIQTDQSGNTYFSTSGAFGSTTLSTKITIATAGNVGIGTTNPGQKLHVSGNAYISGLTQSDTALMRTYSGHAVFGSNSTAEPIALARDGTNLDLVVSTSGNVGIRTTSPVEALSVPSGSGVMLGFKRFYSDTGTVPAGIGSSYTLTANLNDEQRTTLTSQYQYKFYLTTTGTGTYNSSVYIVYRNSADTLWDVHRVSSTGLSSNHPELTISGNNALIYNDHPNAYGVFYRVETSYTGQPKTSPEIFGSDYMWTRDFNNLHYTDGNVGIGTDDPGYKLDVNGSFRGGGIEADGTIGVFTYGEKPVLYGYLSAYSVPALGEGGMASSGIVSYFPLGEAMRIDNSGNVGIGTTSPSQKLHVVGTNSLPATSGTTQNGGIRIENGVNNGVLDIGASNATGAPGWIQSTDKADLSQTYNLLLNPNGGNVGIGTTSPGQNLDVAGNIECSSLYLNNASSLYFLPTYFGQRIKANCQGLLVQNGSTYQAVYASAFSVQSDYRLKSNVVPLDNAIDRLKQMSVHRFNWNDRLDEPKVDGFIAHELSEVVPEAVLGEKDATKEDGTPDYQGIDQSKIVPLLTAALQDAITKIEQLETRIQTLENND